MRILRVFPRKTNMQPQDDYAFVGDPPMMRPEADEVHISVIFTWDIAKAEKLRLAWQQYYPVVKIGGPAYASPCDEFTPGMYIASGIIFTSRGCNNNCSFCLVHQREGNIKLLPVTNGYMINDNNLLQTGKKHMEEVFNMLKSQRKAAIFAGGFQTSLVDDWVAEQLRGTRIKMVFVASDTIESLKPLQKATSKLSFLPRRKLRCYMLLAYKGESIDTAKGRLEEAWGMGCMPFAQLYQPPGKYIDYSKEWRDLARKWSRPAAMVSSHKQSGNEVDNDIDSRIT